MLQYGEICKKCGGDPVKCKDVPGEMDPVAIECVSCNGAASAGCETCGGEGLIMITGCPLEIITTDVWDAIEYAEFWEKGLPPVAGGSLDQAQNFLIVSRFIFNEQRKYKNKQRMFE